MRIIIAPDSFKGAATSQEAGQAIAAGVREAFLGDAGLELDVIPMADGGEGTVDSLLAATGGRSGADDRIAEDRIAEAEVTGVFPGETIDARYGLITPSSAVIEMAAAAGLPLAAGRLDPLRATTYGVGELIDAAITHGAREIIVGAGGSATTDAGCGAAAALGATFRNAEGKSFVPTGGSLSQIASVDVSALRERVKGVSITVMCDIDNPLYGPRGAACVFAPQKGADLKAVELLDAGLRHVAGVFARDLGVNVSTLPGSGAAGGLAAGLVACAGAQLKSGIDVVLDAVDFDELASAADLIITGEGRIDGQSLAGKVPVGIARRASAVAADRKVPVVVLAGAVGKDTDALYGEGITAVFPIGRRPQPEEAAIADTAENLRRTARDVARLYQASCETRAPGRG